MTENEIDRKVYYDLLATEFARKHKTNELTTIYNRCLVMYQLLSHGADSDSMRETMKWNFHNNIEAAFLLAKQGLNEKDFDIPPGLYS